jgi:hypothetical protein
MTREVWDQVVAELDAKTAGWKADLTKHIRDYDRSLSGGGNRLQRE